MTLDFITFPFITTLLLTMRTAYLLYVRSSPSTYANAINKHKEPHVRKQYEVVYGTTLFSVFAGMTVLMVIASMARIYHDYPQSRLFTSGLALTLLILAAIAGQAIGVSLSKEAHQLREERSKGHGPGTSR